MSIKFKKDVYEVDRAFNVGRFLILAITPHLCEFECPDEKQALEYGKIIKEKTECFCFETIILATRTYLVPTYSFSYTTNENVEKTGTKKIYNAEVMIDGVIRSERWGTNPVTMNQHYKILKEHCEG